MFSYSSVEMSAITDYSTAVILQLETTRKQTKPR